MMYECGTIRQTDNCGCRSSDRCPRNCGCRSNCVLAVLWMLTVLLFFVVGAIAGAFLSGFVIGSIVAIAIFAIVILLALVITAFLTSRRCCRK